MRGGRFSIALCAGLVLGAIAAAPAGSIGFLFEWGGHGNGPGEFGYPISVAVDGAGNVYVADSENDRIEVFDETGQFLREWGTHGAGPGQFSTPESVAVDTAGNVYAADLGNYRVEKFDADGNFLTQWGREGSRPGELRTPEGIAVDDAGNVYVADGVADRIEKFTSAGAFVTEWGAQGSGPGQFDGPDSVATDSAGNVYVADSGNDRVQKFTGAGAFLQQWGSEPGGFEFPVAVATDAAGRVYVADSGADTVQKFTGSGKLLAAWGDHGSDPGLFSSPVALAVGAGGRVFVADASNDRIEAFGTLPAPAYGKTVNLGPVDGIVRIKPPGGKKFFVLGSDLAVPVGAIVDTSRGRVRLTSAKGPGGGAQSADFFDGRFKVLQPRHGNPVTVLKLANPVVCGKAKHRGATASRKRGRGLWGSGKGNFRSEGKHGSATVRGTIWWAQDRCDGTKFKVKRGVVTIRDFTNHTTLKLHKGETYLAPAG